MNAEDTNSIKLQVGVKALLKNKDGKYLLLHRNVKKYPDASQLWDIVGGRINPGRSILENLTREIYEETKLKLTNEPKLIAAQDILRKPGYHIIRLTYLGEIDGDPILDDEHDNYKYFKLSEIKSMAKDQIDCYFKELLDKGLFGS